MPAPATSTTGASAKASTPGPNWKRRWPGRRQKRKTAWPSSRPTAAPMSTPRAWRISAWAAADLTARLASLCPACGTPGFWQVDRVAGLPCAGCGAPTRETRA
ncbi:DUF6671 family protein [Thiobacillus sp.]|uniref:DUF6671 family protein n=1 Tax=Thiobacillus sp. TaxID=924 RepID=UPI00343F19C2